MPLTANHSELHCNSFPDLSKLDLCHFSTKKHIGSLKRRTKSSPNQVTSNVQFDKKTRTNWPRKVRELILDPDP